MRTPHHLLRSFLCLGMVLLFSCCSPDPINQTDKNNAFVMRQNTANPFDETGMLYEQIYQNYLLAHTDSVYSIQRTIAEVEQTAALLPAYNELKEFYTPISASVIEHIVFNSHTVDDYIQSSALSPTAQYLFSRLNDTLVDMTANDVYDMLIDFEDSISKNTLLISYDKEILLNCSSILRYSLDNGDRDWDDDKNGIIKSTLVGMQENTAKAIIMAVVVQVAVQQQVAIDLQN